jgi:hypothetical protein
VLVASAYGRAPIASGAAGADDGRMHRSAIHDPGALLAAATRLEAAAAESDSARHVAMSLVQIEGVLRSLDRTCLGVAASLLPGDGHDDIASRYRRAAARWDADAVPPSYERQAQILASLHDAGATLRAAAECCQRARTLIEGTYGGAAPATARPCATPWE